MIKDLFARLSEWLVLNGTEPSAVEWVSTLILSTLMLLALGFLYWLLSSPVARVLNYFVDKTETELDDIFLSPKIVDAMSLLIVAAIGVWLLPALSQYYPEARVWTERGARVALILAGAHVASLEVRALCIFLRRGNDKRSGVLVLRNVLNTAVFAIAAILCIASLMGKTPMYVLSGIGAMAAILMLVFKDSILGMMAGIRLSLNGMLKEHDWISVPTRGADGRVEDVSLTAVKVRNWDKSIALIPPHSLVSEGFINRERMLDLGVRQLKRSINIDIHSVRHITQREAEKFATEPWYPAGLQGEQPVNLMLFRRWLRHTLLSHPRRAEKQKKHPLQVMARELPATPEGIPVEMFLFIHCPDWEEFEELQADLMDRILASLHRFGLRAHQSLSGADLRSISTEVSLNPALQ